MKIHCKHWEQTGIELVSLCIGISHGKLLLSSNNLCFHRNDQQKSAASLDAIKSIAQTPHGIVRI